MRYVAGVFCILMMLFVAVQYNDPDVMIWGTIYGISAIWCGVVALRPKRVVGRVRQVLFACMILSGLGVIWYWPKTPGFWNQEVWWVTETAREGMGMIVAFIALSVAWIALLSQTQND